ncbi:MAG: chromosomal replication initiation protein, partial [Actinomycetales bacterium]
MTDAVDSEPDLSQVWSDAIDTLGNSGRVWVYSAQPLSLHGGLLIVAVPDEITRRHIESRVRPALEHALSSKLGADTRLVVTIEPDLQSPRGSSESEKSPATEHHSTLSTVMPRDAAPVETEEEDEVDDFVPSWATAPAVAPARVGNAAEARL